MTENEALARMIAPGTPRAGKPKLGVIQIHVTRACNLACYGCTQGSNLAGKTSFISLEHFEQACESLASYWGTVGIFGGCPTIHPRFEELCFLLRKYIPRERRGLWANNLMGKGQVCRDTFSPAVSNLNVHLDRAAYNEMLRDWPECRPFGLTQDSRHSPPYVAMQDVIADEGQRWELIAGCDINQFWSAMIGVFRGQLRAWFCEIAGAQAMLHQDDLEYPDTGLRIEGIRYSMQKDGEPWIFGSEDALPANHQAIQWWQLPMRCFAHQVRKHCHECGIPLRGHGQLSQAQEGVEQTSETHADIYRPKRKGRRVELVTVKDQLGPQLERVTAYLQNGRLK